MTDYIDVTNLMAQPIKSMGAITELCLELQRENLRLQDIVEGQHELLSCLHRVAIKSIKDGYGYILSGTVEGLTKEALSLTATEKETKE